MATIKDNYVLDIDTKGAQQSLNGIKAALGGIASAIAVDQFGQFIQSITDATQRFERLQVVLETYLGSQEAANKALTRLQDLAVNLPQDLEDIANAFTILTRRGLNTSSEAIENLSNIATANNRSLQQLAEALGDALVGEFERLKEFGINVERENGRLQASIGSQMVATADTAKELVAQLRELGETRFAGAAEANADTLNQSLSNLRGAVFEAQVAFGKGLKPELIEVTDEMSQLLRQNKRLAETLGAGLGDSIRVIADAAALLAENINLVSTTIQTLIGIKFLKYLKDVTAGMWASVAAGKGAKGAFGSLASSIARIVQKIPGIGLLVRSLKALTGPIGLAVTAVTTLVGLLSQLSDVTVEVGNTTTTYGEIARAVFFKIRQAVVAVATAISEFLTEAFEIVQPYVTDFVDLFKKSFVTLVTVAKSTINTIIGFWVAMFKQITVGIKDIPKIFLQSLESTLSIVQDFVGRVGQQFVELWDFIASRGQDTIENSFSGISETVNKEIGKIGDQSSIDWQKTLDTDFLGNAVESVEKGLESIVKDYRNAQSASQDAAKGFGEFNRQLDNKPDNQNLKDTNRELQKHLETLKEINQEYEEQTQSTIDNLKREKERIGLSEREREIRRDIRDFTEDYEDTVERLRDKLAELQKNPEKNREAIVQTKAALEEVKREYDEQLPKVKELSKEIQDRKAAEEEAAEAAKAQARAQERVKDAIEESKRVNDEFRRSTRDMREDLEQLNMTEFEKQIDDIKDDIRGDARNAIRELKDELKKTEDPELRAEIKQQIESIKESANEAIRKQVELAKRSREHQRTFAFGWEKAFQEYENNATNAANTARELFQETTQGIEDMIVEFTETGKFKWRDFIDTIVDTLLRSQIQQLIAKTFDPENFSGDGVLGSIGEALGIGGAGNPLEQRGKSESKPLYVQDVSNSLNKTSQELKGLQEVVGGQTQTQSLRRGSPRINLGDLIGDTVSIGETIADYFAGYFASGGNIPAGKFGIAGEAGPEVVSGPASVTPVAGGDTNINYNINAVDAKSFKEMVASDPEFMYAVTERGRSGLPQSRR